MSLYVGGKNRRGVAEQKFEREADWKEAREERSDERAWILSDKIIGTSDCEMRLLFDAISYIIAIIEDNGIDIDYDWIL